MSITICGALVHHMVSTTDRNSCELNAFFELLSYTVIKHLVGNPSSKTLAIEQQRRDAVESDRFENLSQDQCRDMLHEPIRMTRNVVRDTSIRASETHAMLPEDFADDSTLVATCESYVQKWFPPVEGEDSADLRILPEYSSTANENAASIVSMDESKAPASSADENQEHTRDLASLYPEGTSFQWNGGVYIIGSPEDKISSIRLHEISLLVDDNLRSVVAFGRRVGLTPHLFALARYVACIESGGLIEFAFIEKSVWSDPTYPSKPRDIAEEVRYCLKERLWPKDQSSPSWDELTVAEQTVGVRLRTSYCGVLIPKST